MRRSLGALGIVCLLVASTAVLILPDPAAGAPDTVKLWWGDLSNETSVFANGATVAITASDGTTASNTSWANVTDTVNGDFINVTLYDDGSNGDVSAADGTYTGFFTVVNDTGTSGSKTDNATDVLDMADNEQFQVKVDIDADFVSGSMTGVTDFVAPVIIMETADSGFYNESMWLNFTVIDNNLDFATVGFTIDGTNFTRVPYTLSRDAGRQDPFFDFYYEMDLGDTPEGTHTIEVQASDLVVNHVNDPPVITPTVDRTPPDLQFDWEGGFVAGNLTITVIIIYYSGEAPIDDASVAYSLDGGPSVQFAKIAPFTYEATIDTTKLTDGTHDLVVTATDAAGNTYVHPIELIVDNTPPSIDSLEYRFLRDGSGALSLETSFSDTWLCETSAKASWDSHDLGTAERELDVWRWTVPDDSWYYVGTHTIQVEVSDEVGNTKIGQAIVEVLPVPDPCGDCGLSLDPDGTFTFELDHPDPGDVDLYRFYIDTDPIMIDVYRDPPDQVVTGMSLDLGDLGPGTYYVEVYPEAGGVIGDACTPAPFTVPPSSFGGLEFGTPVIDPGKPVGGVTVDVDIPILNPQPLPMTDVPVVVEFDETVVGTTTIPYLAGTGLDRTGAPGPDGFATASFSFPVTAGDHSAEVQIRDPNTGVPIIFITLTSDGSDHFSVLDPPLPPPPPPGDTNDDQKGFVETLELPVISSLVGTGWPTLLFLLAIIIIALVVAGVAASRGPKEQERLGDTMRSYPDEGPEETGPPKRYFPGRPKPPPTATVIEQPPSPPTPEPEPAPTAPPVTETAPAVAAPVPAATVHSTPGNRRPCEGIKEQWVAKKAEAERLQGEAEAAGEDAGRRKDAARKARKDAQDRKRGSEDARKAAGEKRGPMDEASRKMGSAMAQRDQLMDTIVNTMDNVSKEPKDGFDSSIGSEDDRNSLYSGMYYFRGNEGAQEFDRKLKEWEDQLRMAKDREDAARKEYGARRKEFDDADARAKELEDAARDMETDADGKDRDADRAEKDAEAKLQQANRSVDEANAFAERWRHCIRERLHRQAGAAESAARDAQQAAQDAANAGDPEAAEDAAQRATDSAERAKHANDELERTIEGMQDVDDHDLGDEIREADRRGDDAERNATRAAGRARSSSVRMPRQCDEGERKKETFHRRHVYLDEDADVRVQYIPTYGANLDGCIDNEEAAKALAEYFGTIKDGIDEIGDHLPEGTGDLLSVPMDYFKWDLEAGSAAINAVLNRLKEHYNDYGFGTLITKVPYVSIDETWEKRYLCIHGAWQFETSVKVDEKMDHGYRTLTKNSVELKDVWKQVNGRVRSMKRRTAS